MNLLYLEQEWQRTRPDLTVYLPESFEGDDATNQHFNVIQTPSGTLLGFWTQSTYENADNQRVVVSSLDGYGRNMDFTANSSTDRNRTIHREPD